MARLIEVSKHFRVGSASLETENIYIYFKSHTSHAFSFEDKSPDWQRMAEPYLK